LKFASVQLAVTQYLGEQADAKCLVAVHGNNAGPAISVAQEMVAAFDPDDGKSRFTECGD